MDTVTEGYAQWCPSMDGHGGEGYCDIHGHCDRGYAQWCPSVDGQWMVTATVTSMDTVTEG